MSVLVMIAVPDREVEHRIVAAFQHPGTRVSIARRCVDLSDLLGASARCVASAVVVADSLRGLDRETVAHFHAAGLAVIVVVSGGPDHISRGFGADELVEASATPETFAETVLRATAAFGRTSGTDVRRYPPENLVVPGNLAASKVLHPLTPRPGSGSDSAGDRGRIVAVWGPAGAPGRTLLATSLAAEFALSGSSVLLMDADVYAASVAQTVGLVDEIPGLVAACRLANLDELDLASLAAQCRSLSFSGLRKAPPLRVLTGLPRADRWPELRPSALEKVLTIARSLADVTVIDCSSCLERDEELSYDVEVPRRNGATITALRNADDVVVVGRADPLGLTRLLQGLNDLSSLAIGVEAKVVLNRVRKGPILGNPERESLQALHRFAGLTPIAYLPEDVGGVDAAVAAASLVVEIAPRSPYRVAVRGLAAGLLDRRVPELGRRVVRWRRT